MLNPLPCPNLRGRQYYKLEPYVVVAGVYAAAAHLGNGLDMAYRIQLSMECWWRLLGAALVDDSHRYAVRNPASAKPANKRRLLVRAWFAHDSPEAAR